MQHARRLVSIGCQSVICRSFPGGATQTPGSGPQFSKRQRVSSLYPALVVAIPAREYLSPHVSKRPALIAVAVIKVLDGR